MFVTPYERAIFERARQKGWLNQESLRQIEFWRQACERGQRIDFLDFLSPRILSAQQLQTLKAELRGPLDETVTMELTGPEREQLVSAEHVEDQLEILEELGRGGMGVVQRARDRRLNREVAIKLILAQEGGTQDVARRFEARFKREAFITARLPHPAIPPVFEAGLNRAKRPFLLMKLISGRPLTDCIQDFHKTRRKANWKSGAEERGLLEALLRVAEAVAYAHSRGILHRDLKPDNIMVGDFGEIYVLDWGLAKDLADDNFMEIQGEDSQVVDNGDAAVTREGGMLGTLGYLPPEQLDGESNEKSDVFALGSILTEIVSGQAALVANTSFELIAKTAAGDVELPGDRVEVPKEVQVLAEKALQTEPGDRPKAEDFVENLRAFLRGDEAPLCHYSAGDRLKRWVARHPGPLMGLILLLITASLLSFTYLRWEQAESQRLAVLEVKEGLERAGALLVEAQNLTHLRAQRARINDKVTEAIGENDSRFILYSAAEVLAEAELYEESRDVLRRSIESYPPAYRELFFLHRIDWLEDKTRLTNWSQPLDEILDLASARRESNVYVEYCKAIKSFRRKDYKQALTHYAKIEELGMNSALVYNNNGSCLDSLGRRDEALKMYNKAIEIDPTHAMAYYNRALIWQARQEYKRLLADVTTSLLFSPVDYDALILRGFTYNHLNRPLEAKDDFQKALELSPGAGEALLGLAVCAFNEKDAQGALKRALKIKSFKKRNAACYEMLGRMFMSLGQFQKAIASFESFLDSSLDEKTNERVRALIEICRKALRR